MSEPWDHERVASVIEMMVALFAAADLDKDEADAVVGIILPKLWKCSGLDILAFSAAVSAALSSWDCAAFSSRH
jgi:hypothetical protein